jgi:hypothetical protein
MSQRSLDSSLVAIRSPLDLAAAKMYKSNLPSVRLFILTYYLYETTAMYDTDVLVATNNWWTERKVRGAHHYILRIMPFLFDVLNSLYIETRKLPLTQATSGIQSKQIDAQYLITIGIFLLPQQYTTFRVILSLVGDVYNLLTPLKRLNQAELMELYPHINNLFNEADKFRTARNCFTHLGGILTDMDKHGITGTAKTNCGIDYLPAAKGCVHLVWANNRLHFTSWGKAEETTIDKSSFDNLFKEATQLYSELIMSALILSFELRLGSVPTCENPFCLLVILILLSHLCNYKPMSFFSHS